MPQPTATTAAHSVTYTTEADLIGRVKAAQDSDALKTLVTSNTGIYLDIVNRYSSVYPNTIRRDDLYDDHLFNIYRFILDYDPTRGTKLSTYIGNRTDWMCKVMLKQDQRNPVRSGTYGPSGAMSLGTVGDTYITTQGDSITLADETPEACVVDVADKDLKLEEVLAAAWGLCEDKRFIEILMLRHFNISGQTSLSWRQIGEKLDLSHEQCRKIYNVGMATIKQHLRERAA
jgi:DNA-directed RNA polymerase sigma subunit (sigma70/sigma32)